MFFVRKQNRGTKVRTARLENEWGGEETMVCIWDVKKKSKPN